MKHHGAKAKGFVINMERRANGEKTPTVFCPFSHDSAQCTSSDKDKTRVTSHVRIKLMSIFHQFMLIPWAHR